MWRAAIGMHEFLTNIMGREDEGCNAKERKHNQVGASRLNGGIRVRRRPKRGRSSCSPGEASCVSVGEGYWGASQTSLAPSTGSPGGTCGDSFGLDSQCELSQQALARGLGQAPDPNATRRQVVKEWLQGSSEDHAADAGRTPPQPAAQHGAPPELPDAEGMLGRVGCECRVDGPTLAALDADCVCLACGKQPMCFGRIQGLCRLALVHDGFSV